MVGWWTRVGPQQGQSLCAKSEISRSRPTSRRCQSKFPVEGSQNMFSREEQGPRTCTGRRQRGRSLRRPFSQVGCPRRLLPVGHAFVFRVCTLSTNLPSISRRRWTCQVATDHPEELALARHQTIQVTSKHPRRNLPNVQHFAEGAPQQEQNPSILNWRQICLLTLEDENLCPGHQRILPTCPKVG